MPIPSLPFTVQALLSSTLAPGSPLVADAPVQVSGNARSYSQDRYAVSGQGALDIDFGSAADDGCKLVLIFHEQGTNPLSLYAGDLLIPPGGFLLLAASVSTGVTGITVDYNGESVIRCRVFG